MKEKTNHLARRDAVPSEAVLNDRTEEWMEQRMKKGPILPSACQMK